MTKNLDKDFVTVKREGKLRKGIKGVGDEYRFTCQQPSAYMNKDIIAAVIKAGYDEGNIVSYEIRIPIKK